MTNKTASQLRRTRMGKPTARELLKEARLAMLRSQPDEQIETIKRIDAYLAAPSESAMEMVRKIREFIDCDGKASSRPIMRLRLTAAESAALIEDCAERETAALRGLVRRMLVAGNMVRDAMPNSVAVHNWIDVCAEADEVLGD